MERGARFPRDKKTPGAERPGVYFLRLCRQIASEKNMIKPF